MKNIRVVDCLDMPSIMSENEAARLLPKNPNEAYYWERVDRNIGFITREEQEMLRGKKVAIAGCGGMGAALADRLLRSGIGEIRIADCENFEVSNINRQFAARRNTIGQNKAIATAKSLRAITDDTTIIVYPQGINAVTVEPFVEGCDLVIDEIEFWELAPAIILHRAARSAGIPILGCNTAGFGTHLFLFTPKSQSIEEAFGVDLTKALEIDKKRREGTLPAEEAEELQKMLVKVVAPALEENCPDDPRASLDRVMERLKKDGTVSILPTNATFATGFIGDHTILYLLKDSGVKRDRVEWPVTPGYLYLGASKMTAKIVPPENA